MQGFTEKDRWFDVAVKVAREFMKAHIISSDSDRIAVVFYGTVSASPAAERPHLYSLPSCDGGLQDTSYLTSHPGRLKACAIRVCVLPGVGKFCLDLL